MMLNKTPIQWYKKRSNKLDTSNYALELVVLKISTDLTIEINYDIRMIGFTIGGLSHIRVHNEIMVTNWSINAITLNSNQNYMTYNRVREDMYAGVINMAQITESFNPAGIFINISSSYFSH